MSLITNMVESIRMKNYLETIVYKIFT